MYIHSVSKHVLYHTRILYHTHMICTIRVWYNFVYHTCMIRVYVLYAYVYSSYVQRFEIQSYSSTTTVYLYPIAPSCLHAQPIDSTIDYIYALPTQRYRYSCNDCQQYDQLHDHSSSWSDPIQLDCCCLASSSACIAAYLNQFVNLNKQL